MKRVMSSVLSKNQTLIKQFSSLNTVRNDPVLSRYEEKLRQKQKELGFETIEEMVKAKGAKSNLSGSSGGAEKVIGAKTETVKEPLKPKVASKPRDSLAPHVKPLNDILNLEKISKESSETISTLWNAFHSTKESSISASITTEFYEKLSTRLKQFPMFILPLPRQDGYEMILLQSQANQIYFTPLVEYQTHKENARACLTLTFYTDLSPKGIVLMVGEVLSDIIKTSDAQHLVYQLQLFYVTGSDLQKDMVQKFWKEPGEFKYEELIESLNVLAK